MTIFGADPRAVAITLILAAIGGLVAQSLHLPLGYLLGALVSVGALAATGQRVLRQPMTLPSSLRQCAVPVIGVSLGGSFTPEVMAGVLQWWPSLLALVLFIPMAHALAFGIYSAGGIPQREAFFGGVPGGLIESVYLGEQMGADVATLASLQFLRLILTIVTVPLIFLWLTGSAVGSAAGAVMGGRVALGPVDIAVLTAAGIIGVLVGLRLRFPAPLMTGPLLMSALAHIAGLAHGAPPGWLVGAMQVVIGAGLGARFSGMSRTILIRSLGLSLINGVAALALAYLFAITLHQLIGEPVTAVFLAFAPGGVAEMSLIALSLNIGVVYVTTHHVLRIVLAVAIARIGSRRLR